MNEQEFYKFLKKIESNKYKEKKLNIHTRDFNRDLLEGSFVLDNKKLELLITAIQKNIYTTNINLSSNNIDNEGAKILTEKLNINELNLYGNNIEFIGFQSLLQGDFTKLNLGGNNLTSNKQEKLVIDSTIQIIRNNTKLKELELEGCNLFEEDNKVVSLLIKNSTSIKNLRLTLNKLNDESLEHLKDNNTLEYLNLYENNITDKGIKYIAENNVISILILSGCPITNEGIKLLSHHSSIKILGIYDCNNITPEGLKCFIGSNLEEIHVSSDKIPPQIIFYFQEAFEYVKKQKIQSHLEQEKNFSQIEIIDDSKMDEDETIELIGNPNNNDDDHVD